MAYVGTPDVRACRLLGLGEEIAKSLDAGVKELFTLTKLIKRNRLDELSNVPPPKVR